MLSSTCLPSLAVTVTFKRVAADRVIIMVHREQRGASGIVKRLAAVVAIAALAVAPNHSDAECRAVEIGNRAGHAGNAPLAHGPAAAQAREGKRLPDDCDRALDPLGSVDALEAKLSSPL